MNKIHFEKTLIIGVGLIGSSLARALNEYNISSEIYGVDINQNVLSKCIELKILKDIKKNIKDYSIIFDLIIICTPLSTYKEIFFKIENVSNEDTIGTDVVSTKF